MAGQLGKKSKTSIGKLRHRVTIQTPSGTPDEFRGRVTGHTDVATVRAEVVAVGGNEVFQNGTVQGRATHMVRMRYRAGLTPKHRLVWLDTTPNLVLNIVSSPPDVGTSNVIEIMCVREA